MNSRFPPCGRHIYDVKLWVWQDRVRWHEGLRLAEEKSGYIVSVARDAASGDTEVSSAACVELTGRLASSYFASAVPVKPGETGTLFFATDRRGTIYRSRMGPIPNPIPADAEPLQPAR